MSSYAPPPSPYGADMMKAAAERALFTVLSRYGLEKLSAHTPPKGPFRMYGVGDPFQAEARAARRLLRNEGYGASNHPVLRPEIGRRPTDYRLTPGQVLVPGYISDLHPSFLPGGVLERLGKVSPSSRQSLALNPDHLARRDYYYKGDDRTRQPEAMKADIRKNIARMRADKPEQGKPGFKYLERYARAR